MKGLKIIPVFVVLMGMAYVGTVFVEANREPVVITFFRYQSTEHALGMVVLTSVLIGMLLCGFLCSIELLFLVVQKRRLEKRVKLLLGSTQNSRPASVPRTETQTDSPSEPKKWEEVEP